MGTIPHRLQRDVVQHQRLGVVLSQPAASFLKAGPDKETVLSCKHPKLEKLEQLGSKPRAIHAANPVAGVVDQKLASRLNPPQPGCQHLNHRSGLLVSLLRFRMGVINPGLHLTISS